MHLTDLFVFFKHFYLQCWPVTGFFASDRVISINRGSFMYNTGSIFSKTFEGNQIGAVRKKDS
jgi:hypothetical protein